MKSTRVRDVEDLILLSDINEYAVADNLERRFKADDIYTYIGEVLVEVNPYHTLDIYSEKHIQRYHNKMLYENPPHVYAIADECVRNMRRSGHDQCLIISGESGAGKTEASKAVMRYIAAVSGNSEEVVRVKNQLLQSNPVMEAFGNAKTHRNDNSSRFGKYMDIHFDPVTGDPLGGNVTTYLLEKSRVVHQSSGERNFHIFYQIIAGAPESLLVDDLKLPKSRDASYFSYLGSSGCTRIECVDDKKLFMETDKALSIVGFTEIEKKAIYSICAGILYLGNVRFEEKPAMNDEGNQSENAADREVDREEEACVVIQNPEVLRLSAQLFGVAVETLSNGLLFNEVAAGTGEVFRKAHSCEKAHFAREAMAQSLYERMFTWIVCQVDARIGHQVARKTQAIGVLDIYGFEIFGHNGFEQFCINYCNEKLQQLFIDLVLKKEQEEYNREGIAWTHIEYFNNEVIVNLIEKRHEGIMSILDELCYVPGNPSDKDFLEQMDKRVGSHEHYESRGINQQGNFKKIGQASFVLKHYAGSVEYCTDGFLVKNKNTLFQDIKRTLYGSTLTLCKELFPDGALKRTEITKRPVTAGFGFKSSLIELTKSLREKEPHYIRCIKPNVDKRAGVFDKELVKHQIRYLGLVENIRVRRAGFAYRMNYELFLNRYKMICSSTWPLWSGKAKDSVQVLLNDVKIEQSEYALGSTKLFIRNPTTFYKLLDLRDEKLPFIATIVQSRVRGFLARIWLKRWRAAFTILQRFRTYKFKQHFGLVYAQYINAGSLTDFGKSLPWPSSASEKHSQSSVSILLQRIFLNWWAKRVVQGLSPEKQQEMRLKSLGYSLFARKKPTWGFSKEWLGDYLSLPECNPDGCDTYLKARKSLIAHDKTEVIFSAHAVKLDRKGRSQLRAIVLTNSAIYKLDPSNQYKCKQKGKPLRDVVGISATPYEDDALVVHFKDGDDIVFNLDNFQGSRSAELAVRIKFTCLYTCHNRVPLTVGEQIRFTHGGQKSLCVDHDRQLSSAGFRKSSKGISLVLPTTGSVTQVRQ